MMTAEKNNTVKSQIQGKKFNCLNNLYSNCRIKFENMFTCVF